MPLFRKLAFAAAGLIAAAATAFAQTPPANWPKSLTLGTASVGGTYFVYGQGWANLVGGKIGVPISTQQTQGPNQNVLLVQGKQIELGMTTMGVALQAWNGTGGWTQGKMMQDIRALFPMYDTPFHFVALRKSGIDSVAELQGKTVGVGPKAGTPGTYFPLIFDALGIKNVTIRNGQASDMAQQLGDGIIDAFPFAAGLPIAAYSELETTNDVVFFSFTPEELKTLTAKFPEFNPAKIPAGTYKGVKQDQPTIGLFNFAFAHKDMPADLAYAITKAVLDSNAEMVKIHSAAVETVPENVTRNTFLPLHPGAIRYYMEKGIEIPPALVPPEGQKG
jgi:TRAP transporter TAXI family solute receptor